MTTLLAAYEDACARGQLIPDADQHRAAALLSEFSESLARRRRWRLRPVPPAGGFYFYGGVGRGKTMLMDMFFAHARGVPKRRIHFHAFMLEVHARLHKMRQGGSLAMDDALSRCAAALAAEARLLCLDEFYVRDVADAMILGRLFTALFAQGVAVVMTSNIAPDDLYPDGLQRDRFLPFIALLKERLTIMAFTGGADHRLRQLAGHPVFFSPHDAVAARRLDEIFAVMADGAIGAPALLSVQGRRFAVPRAAHGVAMFSFEELCGAPAGAADYLALAQAYPFVIVRDVPLLDDGRRDATLRFVMLIDALYDNRCHIALSSARDVRHIYEGDMLEGAFARAASRLMEMQSEAYRGRAEGLAWKEGV